MCDFFPNFTPPMAPPENKGIAGVEVSRSQYLDMFLPEISTQDFSDNNKHGLRDLPKLSTAKQVRHGPSSLLDQCFEMPVQD